MLMLAIAICVAVLDQFTKFYIYRTFDLHDSIPAIPGLFSLRYVRNTGAAIGIFAGHNHWLVVFSFLVLIALLAGRKYLINNRASHRIALALMLGGIIGNLLDRIRFGYVVDFLDVYLGTHHFPTFNVADSAICVGVGIYIIFSYLPRHKEPAKDEPVPND